MPSNNWAQAITWTLVQDCSNSSADALELLQSCTKPSKLEQLERLHSEYTPHHPMITHRP